jgi:hypothetical protein
MSPRSPARPGAPGELTVVPEIATGQLVVVPVADLDLTRALRAVWLPSRRPDGPAAALVRTARAR